MDYTVHHVYVLQAKSVVNIASFSHLEKPWKFDQAKMNHNIMVRTGGKECIFAMSWCSHNIWEPLMLQGLDRFTGDFKKIY